MKCRTHKNLCVEKPLQLNEKIQLFCAYTEHKNGSVRWKTLHEVAVRCIVKSVGLFSSCNHNMLSHTTKCVGCSNDETVSENFWKIFSFYKHISIYLSRAGNWRSD